MSITERTKRTKYKNIFLFKRCFFTPLTNCHPFSSKNKNPFLQVNKKQNPTSRFSEKCESSFFCLHQAFARTPRYNVIFFPSLLLTKGINLSLPLRISSGHLTTNSCQMVFSCFFYCNAMKTFLV